MVTAGTSLLDGVDIGPLSTTDGFDPKSQTLDPKPKARISNPKP